MNSCRTHAFGIPQPQEDRGGDRGFNPSRRCIRPRIDCSPPPMVATMVTGGCRVCFGLPSGIDEVVMMAHLNKVSPASPYIINVSSVKKGPVSVGVAKSVGSLWILAVGESFRKVVRWCVVRHLRPLHYFGSTARFGFSNPLYWW